jgi:hypothetical protein
MLDFWLCKTLPQAQVRLENFSQACPRMGLNGVNPIKLQQDYLIGNEFRKCHSI